MLVNDSKWRGRLKLSRSYMFCQQKYICFMYDKNDILELVLNGRHAFGCFVTSMCIARKKTSCDILQAL